jgi:hypothetical protein
LIEAADAVALEIAMPLNNPFWKTILGKMSLVSANPVTTDRKNDSTRLILRIREDIHMLR